MKRCVTYIVAIVAIMCCLFGDSCSRKEEFYPELSIWFGGHDLSGSSLSYNEVGGSDVVDIKCNADWRVECKADWLDFTPRAGSGKGRVTLTVSPSEMSRSCVVTISMSDVEQMRH